MTNRVSIIAALVLSALVWTAFASASTYIWKKDTDSYRIYMEIVPAEMVKEQPQLWDADKKLHQVAVGEADGLSHVLVWIYRKSDNAKALDVTLVAEMESESGRKVERPLEKMSELPGVVFGNIFPVHEVQKHALRLKVYSPNSDEYEMAVFEHVGY